LLATSVIAFSALATYVPVYISTTGAAGLRAASSEVLWTEVLVQGLIAGCGTLFTYAKMVSILGPSRAAVFPALAPGLAALMAWPVLGHLPSGSEVMGLLVVIAGLLFAVTAVPKRQSNSNPQIIYRGQHANTRITFRTTRRLQSRVHQPGACGTRIHDGGSDSQS
jgi:drug/metabolite transporter (DMT)-like permease